MLYALLVLAVFLVIVVYRVIRMLYYRVKARKLWETHFAEDRIYTVEEVAGVFRLDSTHFKKLMGILEENGVFSRFTKMGVEMAKDYYSSYELRALLAVLVRKQKLPL